LDEKGDAKQNNEKRGKLSLFNFYWAYYNM
jgi:hypothetical protein